jgi:hypothetical protein
MLPRLSAAYPAAISLIGRYLPRASSSRPLKKLPSVMGIRPVCHEVQRFVEVVAAGLGTWGHAAPMSLGSRMRL